LNSQRYNTSTRLRTQCAAILGVSQRDLVNSESRKTLFRERIGWVPSAGGGPGGSYSSVDAEILHEHYEGQYSLASAFRSRILMGVSEPNVSYCMGLNAFKVYVALIRGPHAALKFMDGSVHYPRTSTMARIHGIRNITLGGIATASILVCFTNIVFVLLLNLILGTLGLICRRRPSRNRVYYWDTLS